MFAKLTLIGAGLLLLAGCTAQTQSVARPEGIDDAARLTPDASERGAWTYLDPSADLASYMRFIVPPPVIFAGQGAKFGSMPEAERQEIADMFPEELKKALAPTYPVVSTPGPGTAVIQFTLIGVTSTVPYLSTATRIIPIGAAINVLSAGAGSGGTLTGSVTYGIEAKDSVSGKVLASAVRDLTPGAFDLSSTLGTKETARAVARDAAAMVRRRLDKIHNPG